VTPKRTQMVIIALVTSFFAGIIVAFGREYWRNHREELKIE